MGLLPSSSLFAMAGFGSYPEKDEKKSFRGRVIEVEVQHLQVGDTKLVLKIKLPDDHKLANNAPLQLEWRVDDSAVVQFVDSFEKVKPEDIHFPYSIKMKTFLGRTVVTVDAMIYYCREDSTFCLFDELRVVVPIEIGSQGGSEQAEVEVSVGSMIPFKRGLKIPDSEAS